LELLASASSVALFLSVIRPLHSPLVVVSWPEQSLCPQRPTGVSHLFIQHYINFLVFPFITGPGGENRKVLRREDEPEE